MGVDVSIDGTWLAGTDYMNKTALDITVMTSRQADLAATFNYASQAHNNHFFFETLVRRFPYPNLLPHSSV